jgi:6-phosphogluconolactonase
MRVDLDPFAAIEDYIHKIHDIAGSGAVLDLVHLGLGADGHTASLIPGDAVLEVTTTDVALTAIYQGRQRMTLTYPIINRCRQILWLVTGDGKSEMLERLLKKDSHIPAGRINQDRALVLADMQAAKRI